jgi:outer membrane receptor protein involved in Fe transport
MLIRFTRLSLVAGLSASFSSAVLAQAQSSDATAMDEIVVTAKRLDAARINIEPRIGASTYAISSQAIDNQPGGQNNPIDQVILQAPGVDQDNVGNGGIHVRNEHLNVQYRINGVVLPDGVSLFGQTLSPRFVGSLQLITGALPAEYGLRTAGIVDIQSKEGIGQDGGTIGIYGGSYGTINPSIDYGGSSDGYTYFVSGDYLQSNHGIEGVTPAYNQIHDDSRQDHFFGYLDKILNDSSRVSLMIGSYNSQFQIPNNPGQPTFGGISAINGVDIGAFDSAALNEHQTEGSQFATVSYLYAGESLDFQASTFTKFSTLHYHPDTLGDLAFNGISQEAGRTSFANGFQGEGTYRLTSDHTVRFGVLVTGEHVTADTNSLVLNQAGLDGDGNPIYATNTTDTIADSEKTGWTYSAYLQDEWAVLPTLTANFGGRFDVVNGYTQGNQFSPRLNVVWQATPTTTVHAGYASYFTPPPLELVTAQTATIFANTSAAAPNNMTSQIKNERSQYLDIGVTQQVVPGLTIGLDVYYKYARNLLDEGQFGAPVILTPFNYNVGYNRGVELTTAYTRGNFSFYGNLAIAKQKAEGINSSLITFDPDGLAYAADHQINTDHSQLMTASAGLSYLWEDTRYSVDIVAGTGVRTTNPGDNINEGTVPSYEQVNLGVSHKFETAFGTPTTARLDLINALDEIYVLRSQTGIGVFASQYGPRRSVFGGITKAF